MILTNIVSTIIIGLVLASVIVLALISFIKKKGKCSCGCEACPYKSGCHKNK